MIKTIATLATLFPTPYTCDFVKVLDGDTIKVHCADWPDPFKNMSLRVHGIDTPESTSIAKCKKELKLGVIAKGRVRKEFEGAKTVTFRWVGQNDKYGGRLLALVELPSGQDLAEKLIADGLAVRYGGGKKFSWCK
jgi:endonuclease YncB( thermonuclease family)